MTQISIPEGSGGADHPLVARLAALRGRVRAIVGIFGVAVVLAAAIGGIFALMLLDYLIHIPASLRLTLLIAWILAIAVLVWRTLLAPMSTRLTDQFLASRVELKHPNLSDELISAVHFIHAKAAISNALAARQIDLAATRTQSLQFADALDFRPAAKAMGAATVVAVIAIVCGLANPALAHVAFSRWFSSNPIAWPMTTHVAFDWAGYGGKPPKVAPLGDKFTVRAKVDKGSPREVTLHYWTDGGRTQTELMSHQKEQDGGGVMYFESKLSTEGSQLSLRVEAGDDHEEPPVTITLAPKPAITDLRASIAPPPYVKNVLNPDKPVPPVLVNLMSQSGRATEGSAITLQAKASKRFGTDDAGQPRVQLFGQFKDEPLAVALERRLTGSSGSDAEVLFTARQSLQSRMVMTDSDGFTNDIGGAFSLDVVPDAIPAVVITDPRRSIERAPDGFVDLTIQATDDWGFRGLKLRAEKFDARETDTPVFETDLPIGELTTDAGVGSTTGKTRYTWELAPLALPPGTRLSFYAMVQDNYDVDGKQHDWVKSAPLSLSIKSATDIQEEQRKALAELNERIRALRTQQDQTQAQTNAIHKNVTQSSVLSQQQLAQLGALAQQEMQEASTAAMLQQRAEQAAEELRQNKMAEGELGKISQEVAAGMQDVGKRNMPAAAASLSKAQESKPTQSDQAPSGNPQNNPQNGSQNSGPQQSAQQMASASSQQQQAIETMDRLINRLGATGDIEAMKEQTRKIMDEQGKVADQTRQVAADVRGSHADQAKAQEQQLAREQNDLRDQTADLLNRMAQASNSLKQSDPGASQSLDAAHDAGQKSDVPGNQGQAGSALAGNKPGDAGNSQTAAQQGLQAMLDELEKNDLRRLEQLVRDIRNLRDEVQKLRDDEATLNKDTTVAGEKATNGDLQKLANRQGTLQQNTIIVQKKAQSTQRAGQAAAFIGEASDHMADSATALYSNKQPDSLKPETDAVASLDAALAELKKVNDEIAPDVKKKQLAEYIKQYQQIKTDQTAVKATSDELAKRQNDDPDKELNHADEQRASKVADTQGELADRIGSLSQDEQLKTVDVIVWMNQQVTEAMTTSQTRLKKQQLGLQLASAQETAIDRIQMIIDALKEEQSKPEFNGGGGGGGGGGQEPLVPPAAQLRLLKAMQVVVNTQTQDINKNLKAAANDADKHEYHDEARQLGGKQEQIHTIADKLVQQLSH